MRYTMGDIADDMIDGSSCAHCGTFFEEEHGYPVLCKECFKEDGGKKDGTTGKSELPMATNE